VGDAHPTTEEATAAGLPARFTGSFSSEIRCAYPIAIIERPTVYAEKSSEWQLNYHKYPDIPNPRQNKTLCSAK
jgi:hypothetical protein